MFVEAATAHPCTLRVYEKARCQRRRADEVANRCALSRSADVGVECASVGCAGAARRAPVQREAIIGEPDPDGELMVVITAYRIDP